MMREGNGPTEGGSRGSFEKGGRWSGRGGFVYAHHRFETDLMQYWMTSMRSSAVDISASVPQAAGLLAQGLPIGYVRAARCTEPRCICECDGPLPLSSAKVPLPCDLEAVEQLIGGLRDH